MLDTPENGRPPEKRIVATYDYHDADGGLLFQVVRFEPKTFRQRRPDGRGGWIKNLHGVDPVLYHLPEVLEAVKAGRTVYVCEGEKDADNLRTLGFTATCNPGGAGKWRDSYTQALKGAHVVILPDNDKAGREHRETVGKALQGAAASVKVLELPDLPEKGDVSDWIQAGGTAEKLEALAAASPDWEPEKLSRPVLLRLADVEAQEVDFLWRPYIPFGKLTLLEGDPGLGKTWIALMISSIVSNGDPFPDPERGGAPGDRHDPGNVVYLTAEDGIADTLRPRLDACGADVSRVYALTGRVHKDLETGEDVEAPVWLSSLDELRQMMEEVRPRLVVVDPLQAFLGADVDMHRANEVRPILSGVGRLAEEYGSAVILIRHLGKSSRDRSIYRGLGSIDLSAAARSILLVGQQPQTEERAIAHTKSSLEEAGPSIRYELRDGQLLWGGVSDLTASDLMAAEVAVSDDERSERDEAADFLRELLADGPVPSKAVQKAAKEVGISWRTVRRAKDELGVRSARETDPEKPRGAGRWVWKFQDDQGGRDEEKPLRVDGGHLEKLPEKPITKGFVQDGQGEQVDTLKKTALGASLNHVVQGGHSLPLGDTEEKPTREHLEGERREEWVL